MIALWVSCFVLIVTSGFVIQHVLPDSCVPGTKEVHAGNATFWVDDTTLSDTAWITIPAKIAIVIINVVFIGFIIYLYVEHDEYDFTDYLEKLSNAKLFKTGLKNGS